MVSSLHSKFMVTENGHTRSLILPKTDKRVQFIRSLVTKLGNACAYFSPECTTYMNNMEVIVVDDDEVNAYTTMGSVVVVYTGLLNYFEKMKEEGKIKDAYLEIGRLFCQKETGEVQEEFIPYVQIVGDAKAQIENLKAQINDLKGVKTCPGCGADVPSAAAPCSRRCQTSRFRSGCSDLPSP